MRIIGIDPSYSCTGICILEDEDLIHAECFKTTTARNHFERCYDIAQYLGALVNEWDIEQVQIEGLNLGVRRSDVTRDLAGLFYTIVIQLSIVQNLPTNIIAPTSVKKYGAHYGWAKKEDMIAALPDAVRDYFFSLGYKKTTGIADLADSFFIAQIYHKEF